MKTRLILFFSSVMLIAAYSCNKEANDDADISNSTFEAEASIYSDELEKSADAVTFNKDMNINGSNGPNGNGPACLPECATVSVDYPDGGAYPRVITIDYGEENCQIRPNLYKRGKIIITLTDSIIHVGAQRLVTFDSFYINDNLVSGSRSLSNMGENEDSYITFDIDNDISIGDWTRETSGSKIWIEGFETMEFADNVFLLTGSSSSTRPNGLVIDRTIIENLRVDRSCGYITEGVVSVQRGEQVSSIDFGDGSCDNLATIYRDDQEFEIELDGFRCRRRH